MRKGIVINLVPVFADKSAYEQQQCGLWLMKIGDQGLDDMIAIPGSYDYLRTAMEHRYIVLLIPGKQCFERFHRRDGLCLFCSLFLQQYNDLRGQEVAQWYASLPTRIPCASRALRYALPLQV